MAKTIKERVVNLVKDIKAPEADKAEKAVLELIHRVQYPENYCPKCEARMFFSGGRFVCDCGYDSLESSEKHVAKCPVPAKGDGHINKMRKLADELGAGKTATPSKDENSEVPAGATSNKVRWV